MAQAPLVRDLDAPVQMPSDLVASTNEPFWRVTVSADTVLLEGPETSRTFTLQTSEVVFDGRYVTAVDARGALELRVAGIACQDSMSGAEFPYSARVTIDGGTPVVGCARGASDPPPTPR